MASIRNQVYNGAIINAVEGEKIDKTTLNLLEGVAGHLVVTKHLNDAGEVVLRRRRVAIARVRKALGRLVPGALSVGIGGWAVGTAASHSQEARAAGDELGANYEAAQATLTAVGIVDERADLASIGLDIAWIAYNSDLQREYDLPMEVQEAIDERDWERVYHLAHPAGTAGMEGQMGAPPVIDEPLEELDIAPELKQYAPAGY